MDLMDGEIHVAVAIYSEVMLVGFGFLAIKSNRDERVMPSLCSSSINNKYIIVESAEKNYRDENKFLYDEMFFIYLCILE